MARTLRETLSWIGRAALAAIIAAAAAIVVSGRLTQAHALSPGLLLLLAALLVAIVVLGARRLRAAALGLGRPVVEELALGALLVLAAHAISQPAGGLDGPLHPLVYLVVAALVAFLPARSAVAITVLAAGVEIATYAAAGELVAEAPSLAAGVALLAAFAVLHHLLHSAQLASGRAAESLALRERVKDLDARAREYRLVAAGAAVEEIDEERWIAGAVRELDEAVGNALEVAEVALRTHTVAVFLVHGDDRVLRLHDCRSLADDVRREGFDAREGILGAALKRRVPMRLCGELRGVTWYTGNSAPGSVLVVPLVDRRNAALAGREDGYLRGLLVADRLTEDAFTADDERLFEATSREVLRAIEIERVMGYIRRTRDDKDRFYRAIEELNRAGRPAEVVASLVEVARSTAPLDLVAVTTIEERSGRRHHRVEAVAGSVAGHALAGHTFEGESGLCESVVRFGTTLPGRELRAQERPQIFDEETEVRGLQSLRIVPLRAGEQVLGTLVCGSKRKGALDADATRRLEVIAMQAAQSLLRARLFEETERLATVDGLTGLVNHRTYQARLDEELARAARAGRKLSLVLVDIDHFKAVNDTYGHATGDRVLQEIARVLQRCARSTDIVARVGGEEMALVLPDTDVEGGKHIAERVRAAVEAHVVQTELGPLRCTLSLGVSAFPDCRDKKALFEAADQCLYFCKRMGRNRSATPQEVSFEARLRAAGEM